MRLCASLLLLAASSSAFATGSLENPQPNAVESGIGVISGWDCSAQQVEVFIDGRSIGNAGTGTLRGDTTNICGHAETGFSLLLNYSALTEGAHTIEVYTDGQLLTRRDFRSVKSGGSEYLAGKTKAVTVENFPSAGTTSMLEWSQSKQSFVVTGKVDQNLTGTYTLARMTIHLQNDLVLDSEGGEFSVSGTMNVTQSQVDYSLVMVVNGESTPIADSYSYRDYGYYLYDSNHRKNMAIVERGSKFVASSLSYTADLGWFNMIEYWEKTNSVTSSGSVVTRSDFTKPEIFQEKTN
ncbi:hypothetical protein [Neptunomonas marina]|uniref:hypothetical protein n=1 Tax=Neptunomonas marina TaxID=1815562 RepID=UPI0013E3F506|nr:hypothetical protein [Neptunomonas marina]